MRFRWVILPVGIAALFSLAALLLGTVFLFVFSLKVSPSPDVGLSIWLGVFSAILVAGLTIGAWAFHEYASTLPRDDFLFSVAASSNLNGAASFATFSKVLEDAAKIPEDEYYEARAEAIGRALRVEGRLRLNGILVPPVNFHKVLIPPGDAVSRRDHNLVVWAGNEWERNVADI